MIAGIIAARVSSSRLYGKVLFDIYGKSVLERMVERMRFSKNLDKIIVATSTNPNDDLIEALCKKNKIEYFRGPEDDLLKRYKMLVDSMNIDVIAKFGADCPLIDPNVVDKVIDVYLNHNYDYVSNYGPPPRTYPEGMTLDVYSSKILTEAYNEGKKPSEREHISPFFWNNNQRYSIHRVDYEIDLSKYRLALDYEDDFKLINLIYNEFLSKKELFTLEDIINWLNLNPEAYKINSYIMPNQGLLRSYEEDKKHKL